MFVWYYMCDDCGMDDSRYADSKKEFPKECDACGAKVKVHATKLEPKFA